MRSCVILPYRPKPFVIRRIRLQHTAYDLRKTNCGRKGYVNQMKKRKRHTGKIPKKRNEVLVALPIIIILAFVCGSRFGNAVGRTAVIGAGLMLPEGAVLSAKSSAVRSIEKSVSAQSSQQNAVISLPSEKTSRAKASSEALRLFLAI